MDPAGKRPRTARRQAAAGAGDNSSNQGYLDGQLLIAMPVMGDPRFERSVIYLCAHSSEGAMGIIVNRPAGSMTPFTQDVVEAVALEVSLTVDGELAIIQIPPAGISGGPAAVYAATGVYAR